LWVKLGCVLVSVFLVCACHHDQGAEGPFERAGASLDRASVKTGQALSGAATATGTAVQKAGHATGKAFEKVGDKLDGKSPSSSSPPVAPSTKKSE
jgi:hypothetical protein